MNHENYKVAVPSARQPTPTTCRFRPLRAVYPVELSHGLIISPTHGGQAGEG
jgi:hypothetical protein